MAWYESVRDEFERLVRAGKSGQELAEHFGISLASVNAAKKALGLQGLVKPGPKPSRVEATRVPTLDELPDTGSPLGDLATAARELQKIQTELDELASVRRTLEERAETLRAHIRELTARI